MQNDNVPIPPDTRAELADLAALAGKTMSATLADAVHSFRSHFLLRQMNAACAVLISDPEVWDMMMKERALWDRTLLDGMEETR